MSRWMHYDPGTHLEYGTLNEPPLWPCGQLECVTCHERFAISHPKTYSQLAAELRATRPDLKQFAVVPE